MKDLKPKRVKGRITVLKALPYKDHMIYIRKINDDIFMYDLIFNNQLYSSYMIFTPRPGQTKLSKVEVQNAVGLIWAGAISTINMLLGKEIPVEQRQRAEMILGTTRGES